MSDREIVENIIYTHLVAIRAVLKEYCPNDSYFTASMTNDAIYFNNKYWDHKDIGVINFFKSNKEE